MVIKQAPFFFLLTILWNTAHAQREVDNVTFGRIDDFDQMDSIKSSRHISEVHLYSTDNHLFIKDSAILFAQMKWDRTGRLKGLVVGDNLRYNKVDYQVDYEKLSDTLFESNVRFPDSSKAIPDEIYVDTVIEGKARKYCLYSEDDKHNIVIRSLYSLNSKGELLYIRRFDRSGILQQIYYPLGNRKPTVERTDSTTDQYTTTVKYHAVFKENSFDEARVYNRKRQLLQQTSYNKSIDGSSTTLKDLYIYDTSGHVVAIIHVDGDNQFLYEERNYYANGVLTRSTEDNDLSDSLLTQDNRYDSLGRKIFSQSCSSYGQKKITTWRYYYNDKGLREKDELYVNSKFVACRWYVYKTL